MVDKERAKQAQIEKVHDIVDLMEKNSVHICPDRANRKSNCEISQKILVFIEDTNSGFVFYERFFSTCYPEADIELVPLSGYGNIKYIPEYKYDTNYEYDFTIIIYDRGRSNFCTQISDNNRKDIPRAVRRLKKRNSNTKIYVFSPLCFESIPLSFSKLLSEWLVKYNIGQNMYTQLHNDLVNLLEQEIDEINWIQYIRNGQSVEKLIEEAVENITRNTVYEISHHPSNISDCWIENCLPVCERLDSTYCNVSDAQEYDTVNKEKLELLAAHSALGGLTYIMDIITGIKFRTYPAAISNSSLYKTKLIIMEA